MARRIILLSGPVASGKSTLAENLSQTFDVAILSTRDVLYSIAGGSDNNLERAELQTLGNQLDETTNGEWVRDGLRKELFRLDESQDILLDSIRTQQQIDSIRKAYGRSVTHIHLTASLGELERRYNARQQRTSPRTDSIAYQQVREDCTELQVEDLMAVADVVIDSERCTSQDVLVRVASHLRLYCERASGYVDVIVGGQYGSEGKGQIAAYLATEYDLLVRVGGPNAGHKVFEEPVPYTHHQLPSGTRRSERSDLLIGAGAVLNVEKLMKEIAECNVDKDRLKIDRRAMIIDQQEDLEDEANLVMGIGSTGQGVGAATSRRIMSRNKETKLAGDIPELKPYISDGLDVLQRALSKGMRICLEGTQGTGLSLYHGNYPYVTSRDTTVAGCIAEAGIPPALVRNIIMVCRTYPIRVESPKGGTSGPMSQELCLRTIAERSEMSLKQLEATERTSTTNRSRRIGEFDWDLLRRASFLNRPTDVALTFTDYINSNNSDAKRFEQLDTNTINFIQEIECVSNAKVSLIATGFNHRSIIDRRTW